MAWALRPSIAISSASPRCARSSSADSPFNSTLSERASHRRAHSPAQPLPRRPPQGLTPVQTDARVGTAIIVNDNRRGGQVEYAHPGAGQGARSGARRLHPRPPPMKLGAVAGALAVDRTPDGARPEALFARAAQLGLHHIELSTRGWDDPTSNLVERVRDLSGQYAISVSVNWGDRFIAHGPDQPTDGFEAFVTQLCRPLDVQVIGTTGSAHAGRWLKEPPLAEQLSRLTAALRRLAPVAEGNGVKIAIENHAD